MNNNAVLMQDFLGFKLSSSLKQKANVPIIPTILRNYRPMKLSFTVILSWFLSDWTIFDICTCLSMKICFEYITFKKTSSAFHLRIRNAPESFVYCRTSPAVDKGGGTRLSGKWDEAVYVFVCLQFDLLMLFLINVFVPLGNCARSNDSFKSF